MSVLVELSEDMWGLGESGSALGSGSYAFNNTTSFDPKDNFSLSCTARSIQGSVMPPYFKAGMITARAFHVIIMSFLIFTGGFLNLLVVVLVAKYKKLQTVSFGIALQIAALNAFLSAFIKFL